MTRRRLLSSMFAVLVAALAGVVLAFPASPAAAAPGGNAICDLPIPGMPKDFCNDVVDAGSVISPIFGVGNDALNALYDKASKTFEAYSPKNILENWAVDAARGSAEMLAVTQNHLLASSKPDLTSQWFTSSYGVTFGIGVVGMAFALMLVSARLGGGGPDAIVVLREAGVRSGLFMPTMMLLPALVTVIIDALWGLAGWFGAAAAGQNDTAVKWYVDSLNSALDPASTVVGGILSLLVLAGVTFIAALLAQVELAIADYGIYICTLLLPILGALAINPAWRRGAAKVSGVLGGLLLTPVALFFSFWVLWSAAAGLGNFKPSSEGRFHGMLVVAIAAVMAVIVPIMIGFLVPLLMPGADPSLGGAARTLRGGGALTTGVRLRQLASRRGGESQGGRGAAAKPGSQSGSAGGGGTAGQSGGKNAAAAKDGKSGVAGGKPGTGTTAAGNSAEGRGTPGGGSKLASKPGSQAAKTKTGPGLPAAAKSTGPKAAAPKAGAGAAKAATGTGWPAAAGKTAAAAGTTAGKTAAVGGAGAAAGAATGGVTIAAQAGATGAKKGVEAAKNRVAEGTAGKVEKGEGQ